MLAWSVVWAGLRPRVVALSSLLLLCGCTGVGLLDADVADYRKSFAKASNEQILQNVIRARDHLPIHFAELLTAGSTLQLSGSLQASIPFGPLNGSNSRDTLTPTVGLQNNPIFSMGTLETQDFTKGILSPVDVSMIKQFLDQGIDPRVIFILFFAEVQTANGTVWFNNFRCGDFQNPVCYKALFKYLGEVDRLTLSGVTANLYTVLTPVGPPVAALDSKQAAQLLPKDMAAIDLTKYTIRQVPAPTGAASTSGPWFQLYSIAGPKLALCTGGVLAFTGGNSAVCKNGAEIIKSAGSSHLPAFEIRSVYQIIEYLGQILDLQDADAEQNRCVVLGGNTDRHCDTGDVLFQVNSQRGPPIVTTSLDGRPYWLVEGSCNRSYPCDHSTEILGILTLLLNANKVAKDIPAPSLVQVVP